MLKSQKLQPVELTSTCRKHTTTGLRENDIKKNYNLGPLKIVSFSKFIPLTFWVCLLMCLSRNAKKTIPYLYFSKTMNRSFHDIHDLTVEREMQGYPVK